MLNPPQNWPACSGRSIAISLLDQVPLHGPRGEVAKYLICASLGLLTRWYAMRGRPQISVATVANFEWRINDYRFVYLPDVNDEALCMCRRRARSLSYTYLFAPPEHERVLYHALKGLLGKCLPIVMAIDSYVGLRTAYAAVDFKWTAKQTNLEFLEAYNRCAVAGGAESAILVLLPQIQDGGTLA